MISVEDWAEIRRLHRAEGLPIKQIARMMKVSRWDRLKGRIPAIVATLATDGWDRIGFNARQCGLGR